MTSLGSTGAQLRSAQDELDYLRTFVEWCASLDRPHPDPAEEQARRRIELKHVALTARAVLS